MKSKQRLNEYAQNGLGQFRGEVKLSPHKPIWKRIFSDEAHLIYDELRIEGIRLYHIGSTSIPNIAAKPIIDILGSVPSLEELDSKNEVLINLGYEVKGEYGIPGRRYFVLYDSHGTRFVHLHTFQHESREIEKHLIFRDYLRANPTAAKEYEADKMRILQGESDWNNYTDAKDGKISQLIHEARQWTKPPRKVLAILGSAPGGQNTRTLLNDTFPDAELHIVDLAKQELSPYRYSTSPEDAFVEIVKQMLAAELVVFATPVYWYAMSGPMKDFFDRFSNLLRGPHKGLGEALAGKKVLLLSTGSDERLPFGFEVPFASTAIYLAMDYLGANYKPF